MQVLATSSKNSAFGQKTAIVVHNTTVLSVYNKGYSDTDVKRTTL